MCRLSWESWLIDTPLLLLLLLPDASRKRYKAAAAAAAAAEAPDPVSGALAAIATAEYVNDRHSRLLCSMTIYAAFGSVSIQAGAGPSTPGVTGAIRTPFVPASRYGVSLSHLPPLLCKRSRPRLSVESPFQIVSLRTCALVSVMLS